MNTPHPSNTALQGTATFTFSVVNSAAIADLNLKNIVAGSVIFVNNESLNTTTQYVVEYAADGTFDSSYIVNAADSQKALRPASPIEAGLPLSTRQDSREKLGIWDTENDPVNVLVIGQSNAHHGQAGGDLSRMEANDRVWIYDPNAAQVAGRSSLAVWDLSTINPKQDHGKIEADLHVPENPTTQPITNSHFAFDTCVKISEIEGKAVRVIKSAGSALELKEWMWTDLYGGTQVMWDDLVAQAAAAGVTNFDYILFWQGENGAGTSSNGSWDTHSECLDLWYDQMFDLGYITSKTRCVAVEIGQEDSFGDGVREGLYDTFTRGRIGYVVPKTGFTYIDAQIHPDGATNNLITDRISAWLDQVKDLPKGFVDFDVPKDAYVTLTQTNGEQINMPVGVLAAHYSNSLPANPAHHFVAKDYDQSLAELTSRTETALTLEDIATDKFRYARTELLSAPSGNERLRTTSALLPTATDWTMGIRMAFREIPSGTVPIYQQGESDGSASNRIDLRASATALRVYRGNTLECDGLHGITEADEFFTVIMSRNGNDYYLSVNNGTPAVGGATGDLGGTYSSFGGASGIGFSSMILREIVVYNSYFAHGSSSHTELNKYLSQK